MALVGAAILLWKENWMRRNSLFFISFAAGGLLAAAFLDLIPESFEKTEPENTILWVLFGFLVFFLIERVIVWYHCHDEHCDIHASKQLIIFGDSMHNFLDGVAIAAGFLVSIPLGITIALAVMFHELPQEFGDIGILIHGGWSRRKAILYNSLSALTSLAGALLVYFFSNFFTQGVMARLIGLVAGGFIYIASSDLIPEIHKEYNRKRSAAQLALFIVGLVAIAIIARLLE